VTRLRKMMLEELQRRNYSEITTRKYLQYVTAFARHFGKSPDQLGPNELRSYQAYLLQERKVTPGTAVNCVAALRFFFVKTLKRHQFREFLPYPKDHRRLPTVLSPEGVVVFLIGRSMNLPDAPSQNQNLRSLFSWTNPSDSRTVAGRNSICPFWLIWRSWGDLKISGGIFWACLVAKVAGSYSTTASGSCNTQSLLLGWFCARRFRLAKASAACASILEVTVIISLQIVPLPATIGNSMLKQSARAQVDHHLRGCPIQSGASFTRLESVKQS
jgi:Phage integrase, N-terminal SAM-like domain